MLDESDEVMEVTVLFILGDNVEFVLLSLNFVPVVQQSGVILFRFVYFSFDVIVHPHLIVVLNSTPFTIL